MLIQEIEEIKCDYQDMEGGNRHRQQHNMNDD